MFVKGFYEIFFQNFNPIVRKLAIMPVAIKTRDTPIRISKIPKKAEKKKNSLSLSFNKIVPYQINANPAPNKIKTKATSKKNTKISIFPT